MTTQDFYHLSPLIILAAAPLLLLLLIVLRLNHRTIHLCSLALYALAFIALLIIRPALPRIIEPLLIVDGFSVMITGLIIFAGLVVNILSYLYFDNQAESPKEFYVLLFIAVLGGSVLTVSQHFVSLFLGLEMLTITLYILIAYLRSRPFSIEAATKYLILASFSSAFLLFGIALIYLQTGSMAFSVVAHNLAPSPTLPPLFLAGLGMILVGLGFKLAVVPFHMWAADVYQGASAPVTAFIATASKGAVLAVMLRFFIAFNGFVYPILYLTLLFIAIASMLIGNLLALQQRNVKRILAYSSIAHLGYLLVAFIPGNRLSIEAVSFYLLAYFVTTLTAFGIITLLSDKDADAEDLEGYSGLFWRQPLLATIFTAALLSLAGIPLTIGFIGKFYVLAAGLQGGYWIAVLVLVLTSVIGLYYYLRIITKMFSTEQIAAKGEKKPQPLFYLFSGFTLSVLCLLIIWLGIYPAQLMNLIEQYLK